VGGLYAANTAGAMCGTLAITFAILPALGFRVTTIGLAALNFACAAGALALGARRSGAVDAEEASSEEGGEARGASWALPLFATGLLGIAFETIGIRMLTQILENTIYTFAVVLSVYLAGTAIGAALYQRLLKDRPPRETAASLLSVLSLCCLLGISSLDLARDIHAAIGDERGFAAAILSEAVLAALLFLAPTVAMGATFAALAQAFQESDRTDRGGGLGRALAINTLGSALAPSLSGWLLVPALGLRWASVAVALGYAVVAWSLGGARSVALVVTSLGLVGWIATSDLSLVGLDAGERVLERRDGPMATVTVTERSSGARVLRVDNHFRMGGTQSAFLERRQGAIPLLLHPAPRRALFLGLGSGATASAATLFEELEADGVELVPEVIDSLPYFELVNLGIADAESVRLGPADARRFVRSASADYDVIVADLFQPARDGAGALYTVEHFEAVRDALAEGGLFAQWLPLYQMDEETTATIVASFLDVFPDAHAFLAAFNAETPALGLVGSREGLRVDPAVLEARMQREPLRSGLVELALTDAVDLLGCRLAGEAELVTWAAAGSSVRNTDDRPVVMFHAPRFVYGEREPGWTTLVEMMDALDAPASSDLLVDGQDDLAARVDAYALARDAYLEGRVAYAEGREGEALERYVESVELSRDFTVGYTQVTAIANAPQRATREELLRAVQEIWRLRPDLGDLRMLVRQLGGE
ncbi:MAG: spermidine synthase, partial [Planctomycetota bacterium]